MSKKELIVPCPTCKILVPRQEDTFPFCSERCKTIDLGNWASDSYAIKGDPGPDDMDNASNVIH